MLDRVFGDTSALDRVVTVLLMVTGVVLVALSTVATIPGTTAAVHGVMLAVALGAFCFAIVNHRAVIKENRDARLEALIQENDELI